MNCPPDYNCYYTMERAWSPETWVGPLAAIGFVIAVVLAAIIVYSWVSKR